MQKRFSEYSFYHILNKLNHDQLVMKTNFKGLKRQLSSQITEKLVNDASKWRHMSDNGHVWRKKIQNITFIIFNNFTHDQLVVKTKLKG